MSTLHRFKQDQFKRGKRLAAGILAMSTLLASHSVFGCSTSSSFNDSPEGYGSVQFKLAWEKLAPSVGDGGLQSFCEAQGVETLVVTAANAEFTLHGGVWRCDEIEEAAIKLFEGPGYAVTIRGFGDDPLTPLWIGEISGIDVVADRHQDVGSVALQAADSEFFVSLTNAPGLE